MCGACATPIVSVKLNLVGQCRGYSIREDGPGGSGHPMCGACATPTISVKLDRCGQCGGYRIREVGLVTGGEPRCVAHAPLLSYP
ncbi:hypothetical protein D3C79_992820 [compost metagenome]